MAKEKKISFKHFLNQKIKLGEKYIDGTPFQPIHPVYTQIIFDKKNTNVSLDWSKTFAEKGLTEDEFEQHFMLYDNEDSILQIKEKESKITSIIEYEHLLGEKNFTLRGISKRIKYYEKTPIVYVLDYQITKIVQTYLEDRLTVSEFKLVYPDVVRKSSRNYLIPIKYDYFFNVYYRIKELFPDFSKSVSPKHCILISAYTLFLQHVTVDFLKNKVTNDSFTLSDWIHHSSIYLDFYYTLDSFLSLPEFKEVICYEPVTDIMHTNDVVVALRQDFPLSYLKKELYYDALVNIIDNEVLYQQR